MPNAYIIWKDKIFIEICSLEVFLSHSHWRFLIGPLEVSWRNVFIHCNLCALTFNGPHQLRPKGPHQFLLCVLFCSHLFALTLGGTTQPETQVSPPIFIPLIFIALWPFVFKVGWSPLPGSQGSPPLFIPFYYLLWPFCTYNCLGVSVTWLHLM